MPNRILKESICTSADIDKLSFFEEAFFYRLIVNCDDYGRFDGRVAIIKARLLPLKEIKDAEVENVLKKLHKLGLVKLYSVDGKECLQLLSWSNHQSIRNKRSKYPSPDDETEPKNFDSEEVEKPVTAKKSKAKKEEAPKLNYAELVTMTEVEYGKLLQEYGQQATNALIKKLNDYKGSSGKNYKSDYMTMGSWVLEAVKKENPNLFRAGQNPNGGYTQVDPRVNPFEDR